MGNTKTPVKYAVVDAFTDSEFKGNPAAVCLLQDHKEDEWLQSLATEFNLSETCHLSYIPSSNSPHPRFRLRWFTPVAEVDLCGHATLGAAHFCFTTGVVKSDKVEFLTLSGTMTAQKAFELNGSVSQESKNELKQPFWIELDFPAIAITECNSEDISTTSKLFLSYESVVDVKKTASDDLLVVLPSSKAVVDARPNLEEIKRCPAVDRGLIITAAAPSDSGFHFYSRFFNPKLGQNEDPVCGSVHCALAVYWSKKMKKSDFIAYAASCRSGILKLRLDEVEDRVKLQGKAVTVMEGSVIV